MSGETYPHIHNFSRSEFLECPYSFVDTLRTMANDIENDSATVDDPKKKSEILELFEDVWSYAEQADKIRKIIESGCDGLEQGMTGLGPVLRAYNWWKSGDSSKEDFLAAVEEYRNAPKGPTP